MRLIQRLAFAATMLAAAPVLSGASLNETTAGYTYFNKPGADLAQQDADLGACRIFAGTTVQPANIPGAVISGNPAASFIAFGIVAGAAVEIARRHGIPINVENCMVAKGWRVVRLEQTEGKDLAALNWKDRRAKIAAWIGAETPHGDVVRVFANEGLHADVSTLAQAVTAGTPIFADSSARIHEPDAQLDPDDPTASSNEPYSVKRVRLLKPGGTDKPEPGEGLIVVNVAGEGDMGLVLERVDKDGREILDHDAAEFIVPLKNPTATIADGSTMIFAVAPGRWRLAALRSLEKPRLSVDFCFGAPSFSLPKGDAVYLGYFNGASRSLDPDMDPARAKAAVAATTSVLLHAAEWTNGAVGRCHGEYIYALELPGRPFVDGYHLGSKAAPGPPQHP